MLDNYRTKALSAVTIALIAIFTCVGVAASAYDSNASNVVVSATPTPTPDEDAMPTPTPDEDATPSPTPYENPSDPTPTPDVPMQPTDPMPTPSPTM